MRRRRRLAGSLLTIYSAISLLLCALAIVAWIRSYHTADAVTLDRGDVLYLLFASRGELAFQWTEQPGPRQAHGVFERQTFPADLAIPARGRIVWYDRTPTVMNRSLYQREVGTSLWLLVALLLLPPLALLEPRLHRRRRPPGKCAVCGYDLRASPDRCPECGTPVK